MGRYGFHFQLPRCSITFTAYDDCVGHIVLRKRTYFIFWLPIILYTFLLIKLWDVGQSFYWHLLASIKMLKKYRFNTDRLLFEFKHDLLINIKTVLPEFQERVLLLFSYIYLFYLHLCCCSFLRLETVSNTIESNSNWEQRITLSSGGG